MERAHPRERRPSVRPSTPALAAALVAVIFVVFLPAYAFDYERHEGFVWDDDDHYLTDPLIRADDGWWRIWLDPQPGVVGAQGASVVWNYWPLTRSSLWLDRHLFGSDAEGRPNLLASRVVNVALHAANAILVLVVLRQLGAPGAELAALFFAVHPVTVESVAWITQRKAVLSTFFFLLALSGWLRFSATERARWYAFTTGAFLLALMAKTTTVMLPAVLVLLHVHDRRPWTRRALVRLTPFFAMSLVAGVTSIVFERYIGSTGEAWSAGPAERVAAAGRIVWFYLGKLVWPFGLSFNYPRWSIDAGSPWSHLPSAAIVAVAALLLRFRAGWARPWLLALGCFLANLFPVLGFLDVYGMRYAHVADHWQYLACIPVLALAAGLTAGLAERLALPRLALGAAAGAILVGLAALTWQQAGAYVDRETLWRHTLEREPDSFIAHNNLGTRLLAERRHGEAIEHFRRAIELDPDAPEPHLNLGNALDASGRSHEAVAHWARAVEMDPAQPRALYNLAVARRNEGRLGEVEPLLRRALEADPGYARAREALAWLYALEGRPPAEAERVGRERGAEAWRAAGNANVALPIWSAMGVALAAAAGVCAFEARHPERPWAVGGT